MKKFIHPLLLLFILSTVTLYTSAQNATPAKAPVSKPIPLTKQVPYTKPAPYTRAVPLPAVPTDPSLKGQYEFLLAKSKTINGYKLINPYRLSVFFKSVTDTLKTNITLLKTARGKISEQEKTITELNNQIKGSESSLANTNNKMNEITFLGIPFSKSTYNTIVWSLIIALALAFAFVTIRSAKSIHEAKYRTNLYEEITQEYHAYKVKANDKEKKLARELQDERNKLDDYKSRGL